MFARKGAVLPGDEARPWLAEQDTSALDVDPSRAQYLGRFDDEDVFVHVTDLDPPAPFVVAGIRNLFGRFDDETFALVGRASQIAHWLDTHRFCGRCGAKTEPSATERALACATCKLSVYPRINPAVIVLVRKGDRALLARSARFPVPFFSTLAGFVEAGESLEDTVAREILEEAGIEVKNVRYFGSQPWPFPSQLMIGFTAEHAAGELRLDAEELAEADWFAADDLPMLPPKFSIARALIDAWIAEVKGPAAS